MSIENETVLEPTTAPPGFYQRESAYVRPTDTTGLVFMSILAILLLVFLMRSEKRYRDLLTRLAGSGLS